MHRPHGWGFGDSYGTINRLWKPFRLYDRPGRLCKWRGNRGWSKAVIQIQTDLVSETAGITHEGDHYNGKTASTDIDELAKALGQACPKMDRHDCRFKFALGVAPGHRGDTALVESHDAVDVIVRGKRIEEQRLARARIVEYIPYVGGDELLDDDLGRIS